MAEHGDLTPLRTLPVSDPAGRGNHIINGFGDIATSGLRVALVQTSADRGRVVYQTGATGPGFYIALGVTGQWQYVGDVSAADAATAAAALVTAHNVDSAAHTALTKVDGSRAFTSEIAGITPTQAASLARKDYVDTGDTNAIAAAATAAATAIGVHNSDASAHTVLTKVDGSRAFTGEIAGITPTQAASLARKDYVDSGDTNAIAAAATAAAGVYTPLTRAINTTAPLDGGGDLSADRTLTLLDNGISNAKLRDSGALSVVGRSANSGGDPADISAAPGGAGVLREAGNVIAFGTVATAGIADDAITDAKLRESGALSVIGRSANSTGNPADISATPASGAVLRESGSTVGFGTIATAGIADDAVTDAKFRDSVGFSIVGKAATGTGNTGDITCAADRLYGRDGSGDVDDIQVKTAHIADAQVTLAKQADLADGTIIGRALGGGTGVPQALTAAQASSIAGRAVTQTVSGSSATISQGTNHVLVTYSSGVCTLTLPTEANGAIGTAILIQKANTGSFGIVITPDSGSAINGGTTNATVTPGFFAGPSTTTAADAAAVFIRTGSTAWRFA